MAEAKKKTDGDESEPPKKKGKLLLIIIIAVVVLVLVGGGATLFLLKKKAATSDEEGEDVPVKEERAKPKREHGAPPVFVKLEAFTVKLQSEGTDNYLQAIPELRVLDAHTAEEIKQYNAEIRHKVLLILAGKRAEDLSTPAGMQKLSNEMRVTINGILEPPRRKGGKAEEEPGDEAAPEDPVQAVLFTSFIVQ